MSIELDWEVSDAPNDHEPGPGSHAARPEPAGLAAELVAAPRAEPTPASPSATNSARRAWRLPALAFVLLLAIGGSAFGYLTRLGWQRVTADVHALVLYDEQHSLEGQTALVLNVQDANNPDWLAVRRAQLERSLAAPLPLPMLRPAVEPPSLGAVTALDGDFVSAEVRRAYHTPNGGRVEFVLPQAYLRAGPADWDRTAPPGHFWGAWTDWRSDMLHIRHSERDSALVAAVAPRVDTWLRQACALWQQPCAPAQLYLSGYVGSLEYDPLDNIEVRVEFGEGPDALPPDYFLSLPSPHLAGIPATDLARDLWAEYVAVRLIATLAAQVSSDSDAAALTAQAIAALGLSRADPGYAKWAARQATAQRQAGEAHTADSTPRAPAEADRTRAAYPRRANWREYVIQPGDTLLAIAIAYQLDLHDIVRWNDIPDPNLIHVGDIIYLPFPPAVP